MKWIEFKPGCKLPDERRYVLVQIDEHEQTGMPPAVVVGFLRYAAGDKNCPQFIHPGCGFGNTRKVTHFCDCLGDEFHAPLWKADQSCSHGIKSRRYEVIV
jgi:hypothetical protein